MRHYKPFVAALSLCVLGFVLAGCFGLGLNVGEVRGTVTYDDGTAVENARIDLGERTVTTNAEGSFVVRDLPYKTHTVSVFIDGVARHTGSVAVNKKTQTLNIEIPRLRGSVTGTVTWGDGTPIADATIKVSGETVTSDAQGSYRVDSVLYGNYDLDVYVDDALVYADSVVVDRENVVKHIEVPHDLQYATVAGFVGLDETTPLAAVVVALGNNSTTTDANGMFEFEDVLFGSYAVTVSLNDDVIHIQDVVIDTETASLDILVNRAIVTGAVTYENGQPIDNAVVQVNSLSTQTDALGLFSFDLVPYGTYPFAVVQNGTELATGEFVVDKANVELDIVIAQPRLIVYGKQVDGKKWHIFKAYADGTGEEALTSGSVENWYPRLSPDGTKIVFESYRDRARNIYTMDINGDNVQRVSSLETEDRHAAWSPDGEWLVFHSRGGGHSNYEVYAVRADGNELQRLTNTSKNSTWPSWSPDGTQIVFSSNRDGNYQLFMMNADGSDQVALTDNNNTNRNAVWSPNGETIAFASGASGATYEVCVLDVSDPQMICLTDDPYRNEYPYWSRDGSQILFTSVHDDVTALYMMDADGSNRVMLIHDDVDIEYGSW